jgi:RNA polymerase sigma-70 factor (ECF subfamily)
MLPASMSDHEQSSARPQRPKDADDSVLVERAQAGDSSAFDELARRYAGRVFHLTRRILGDADEAEDALQETFLSAYRGLPRFKREAKFSTWIFRIATNAALMRLRKRRPDTVSLDAPPASDGEGDPAPMELRDWSATPDQELANAETRAAMDEAIAALPPELAAVFLLRDIEGMSNEEAAEATGLSLAAAKSRIHRARLFLRDRLTRHFAGSTQARGRDDGPRKASA